MTRVNLEEELFSDNRVRIYERGLVNVGMALPDSSRATAIGYLADFWHQSQGEGVTAATREQIDMWTFDGNTDLLLQARFIKHIPDTNLFLISGNELQIENIEAFMGGHKGRSKGGKNRCLNALRINGKFISEEKFLQLEPAEHQLNQLAGDAGTSCHQVPPAEPGGASSIQFNSIQTKSNNTNTNSSTKNLLQNSLHNNVAVTPPNHVPNVLAIVPRAPAKLTAKAKTEMQARDRAVVIPENVKEFWEEYLRGMDPVENANPKANRYTYALIKRVCDLLGDEAIPTLRIFLQDKHPTFCTAKHSLPCFEKYLTGLNVQTQKVIAWENGEAPHPDDLDALARQLHAQKLRRGQV